MCVNLPAAHMQSHKHPVLPPCKLIRRSYGLQLHLTPYQAVMADSGLSPILLTGHKSGNGTLNGITNHGSRVSSLIYVYE